MLPDPKSGRLFRLGLGQGFNTSRMNRTTRKNSVRRFGGNTRLSSSRMSKSRLGKLNIQILTTYLHEAEYAVYDGVDIELVGR